MTSINFKSHWFDSARNQTPDLPTHEALTLMIQPPHPVKWCNVLEAYPVMADIVSTLAADSGESNVTVLITWAVFVGEVITMLIRNHKIIYVSDMEFRWSSTITLLLRVHVVCYILVADLRHGRA